jgi:hypothetical protein
MHSSLIAGVPKLMWCVRRDVECLARSHHRFHTSKGRLDHALRDGERFLEVMAMGRGAAAGRNMHVNEAVSTCGVAARQKDRVRVSNESDVS